jgi:S1-C subfamily serine protease
VKLHPFIAVCLISAACAQHRAAAPHVDRATRDVAGPATELARSTVTLRVLSEGFWGNQTFTAEGNGSGFVVDSAWGPVIVTAAHVVGGASEIVVVDPDGRRAEAKQLLAYDDRYDLAVVETDLASRLPTLALGDPPAIGDEVVLVSSPLGLSTTVAFGAVAAERREIDALQLSAGVSPGSSGGLVANRDGQAVAIIRSKAPTSLGAEGIALATPAAHLKRVLERLEPTPLSPRPDRGKMKVVAKHVLATLDSTTFRNHPASASLELPRASSRGDHICVSVDDDVFVAIVDEDGVREGLGEACATIAPGAVADVWIGTKVKRPRVAIAIHRQTGGAL